MKAGPLISLATALLAAAPTVAQNLLYSSFEDVKDNGDCGGKLASVSFAQDIIDLLDDNGQFTSPCTVVDPAASCITLIPQDYTLDGLCSIDVFEDDACAKGIQSISVPTTPGSAHAMSSLGSATGWRSLSLHCDSRILNAADEFDTAVKKGKDRYVSGPF